MRLALRFLIVAVALAAYQASQAGEPAVAAAPHADPGLGYLGCWKSTDGSPYYLRCEPGRVTWYSPDKRQPQFFRATYGSGIVVLTSGRRLPLPAMLQDGALVFTAKEPRTFHRIDQVPAELLVEALPLGTAREVPAAELAAIQAELARRFAADQAVRPDPNVRANWAKTDAAAMRKVDEDNTAYLLRLVAQYGWIDQDRFGAEARLAAFFIVQHSGNLPLMLAALPEVRKELGVRTTTQAAGGEVRIASMYAMLYDRAQVMLGLKQRYGSQMGQDERGRTLILALEDQQRVDAWREEIGLQPLLSSLAMLAGQNPAQAIIIEED